MTLALNNFTYLHWMDLHYLYGLYSFYVFRENVSTFIFKCKDNVHVQIVKIYVLTYIFCKKNYFKMHYFSNDIICCLLMSKCFYFYLEQNCHTTDHCHTIPSNSMTDEVWVWVPHYSFSSANYKVYNRPITTYWNTFKVSHKDSHFNAIQNK